MWNRRARFLARYERVEIALVVAAELYVVALVTVLTWGILS